MEQSSTESDNSECDYGYSAESNRSMYQVTQTEGMLHDKNVKHFSDNLIKNSSCDNHKQVLHDISHHDIVSNVNTEVDNLILSQPSADNLGNSADLEETFLCYDTNTVVTSKDKPFLRVLLNGKPVKMELDTGSTLTCISKASFDALNLHNCTIIPCNYNERLSVANYQYETASCKAMVNVEFRGNSWVLNLFL